MPALPPSTLRPTPGRAPLALCGGAFQPPTQTDITLIRAGLRAASQLIVVITAAHQPPSPRHPLSWGERADLIQAALEPAERHRIRYLPLRDAPTAEALRRALLTGLERLAGPAARPVRVAWPGTADPWLACLPPEPYVQAGPQAPEPTGPLVDTLFNTDSVTRALNTLAPQLPPAVLAGLRDWAGRSDLYTRLREEWRVLRNGRQAWASAPYAPVFVTVDSVLRCARQVLLVRRAKAPGQGLLALPGGFLEQRDTLLQSALRELREETCLDLSDAEMQSALKSVAVFDAPDRSQRGRTITHAHYFDLGERPLPAVRGDDDAAEALWMPVAQLCAAEDQFFDDHFQILDHFLGLLRD